MYLEVVKKLTGTLSLQSINQLFQVLLDELETYLELESFYKEVKIDIRKTFNKKSQVQKEFFNIGVKRTIQDSSLEIILVKLQDLATIKARDTVKNIISFKNKIIMIRLKEKDGFNRRKLLKNQKEVIKEIISQFNNQVQEIFGVDNICLKYDPFVRYDPLGEKEPYRIKYSLDNFLS